MRRPPGDFDRALQMSVEGVSATAIARVLGVATSTVIRWLEKAGRHAREFSDANTLIESPVELQLDEVDAHGVRRASGAWCFHALEVWSRFWAGLRVGRRTLRNTLLFVRQVRMVCGSLRDPVLVTSDDMKYYAPVVRRVFGPGCAHVQVKNRYCREGILRSNARLVHGTPARHEFVLARSEDGTRPNTAYVERINLTARRCCSYLQRRNPGRARSPERLEGSLEILRVYYNFIRPHSILRFGRVRRTPAMQLELTKRPLSFREVMSWVPRPDPNPSARLFQEWTTPAKWGY